MQEEINWFHHLMLKCISGLIGKTELDAAKTSMISEATDDAFAFPMEKLFMERDAEKKVSNQFQSPRTFLLGIYICFFP